jgi:putative lipoic acid-binding regulatory protein
MILNSDRQQPMIDYPCPWDYKLIVTDYETVYDKINDLLYDYTFQCKRTNVSRHGRYETVNVHVIVFSDQDRHDIFKKLSHLPQVKYVL